MAARGGQPGNTNATKNRAWTQAIERALDRFEHTNERGELRKGLDAIAEMVVMRAAIGDKDAVKEISERIEGKVAQRIEATGADGAPLVPATIAIAAPKA